MPLTEAQARQALKALLKDYQALTPDARAQMSEASVVRQFVDRLLEEVLGWPIKDPERYKYELTTQAGRPDLTLFPEVGGTIFIEGKKFGVIKELAHARKVLSGTLTPGQMGLPGMLVDRTQEEQQAINYAFENGGTWAILTNFEKLRLFNARRDWMVLSFETPNDYLHDFDLFWQLSYQNVLKGSLDRLNNLRHTEEVDTTYLAFINEWRERLARDIVERRTENPWAFHPDGSTNLALLRAVVQRFLDRLVIIRFAEDHLVLRPGTLRELYELRQRSIYTFSMDEFLDRFFRQFDQNHNSALFAKDLTDQSSFSDEVLMPLVSKLYEARYRSMPADIIGNTYEQYLGKALVLDDGSITTRDNLETRKKQGSYYTPQVIVRYIVDNSLGRYLYGTENGKPDGKPADEAGRKTSEDIRDLRVLDSACGSGSFLIYAYYVLADFYEKEGRRLEGEAEERRQELAAEGVTNPLELQIQLTPYSAELDRIRDYPRIILETHLYGVDLDPQAAEIAVVNLMMRAMERRRIEKRLPLILDQNVKVGNSLIGQRPDDPRLEEYAGQLAEIRRLRLELVKTPNGPEHDQIVRDIETKTGALNETLETEFAERFTDLERARPFHWGVEFPEVFYGEDGKPLDNPGFTVIFGNPPWEIVKPDLREYYAQFDPRIESRLTRKKAETRITELDEEDPRRKTDWEAQKTNIEESAAYFRATTDYTRQGRGDTATHKLFIERMYTLLRDKGRLGYVVSSGIYTDLGTKPLREMFFQTGQVEYMYGLANVRKLFPAVDSRFKFTLLGVQKGGQTDHFRVMFLLSHAGWPQITEERDASAILADALYDENRIFEMSVKLIERFSPDSLSMMEFQSHEDYEVAEKIYGDWPLLGDNTEGRWNVKLGAEFHMTNARHLFNTNGVGLPLYEGKMFHQFDAFYSETRFWIGTPKGRKALIGHRESDEGQILGYQRPRLVYRDIARSTDERTIIAAILPPNVFVGNTGIVETLTQGKEMLFLLSMMNSLCEDYIVRYKVSTHVSMFYAYQLPMPRLSPGNLYFDAIVPRAARLTCTREEFADLWGDVMGESWDESKGATDPAERQQLRDEIDAIAAHLYGLTRDEFDHILGTFPLVFPDDEAGRAKRERLLAVYDVMAADFGK